MTTLPLDLVGLAVAWLIVGGGFVAVCVHLAAGWARRQGGRG